MKTENYVAPEKGKNSFTCPHCGTLATMKYGKYLTQEDVLYARNKGILGKELIIARCDNCTNKIIWEGDTYIYPDIVAERPNSNMPDSVKQLYEEAGLIYNKSPRAACALLRLAIDRLCNVLGETDRDINKNISALVQKGLPQHIQQALDIVRVVGNKAVHPGQIEFDVDDNKTAIMLMKLLNIIVERLITEPQEIEGMFQQLPDSIKDSIEKRDK